jgi:hypothetical protein
LNVLLLQCLDHLSAIQGHGGKLKYPRRLSNERFSIITTKIRLISRASIVRPYSRNTSDKSSSAHK